MRWIRAWALLLMAALAGGVVAAGGALAKGPERQPYVWRNAATGGGGGYVVGVVFNPTQPNLAYVRTDIGGAYRYDARTQSWVQLLNGVNIDQWSWSGVESIGTDPVHPNRLYLAVGTYTNLWSQINGAIFRSTDYGRTFQRTVLPFKNGSNMPGRGAGERLAVDPNDDRIVYFGARSGNGLWRSTDFGETWSQVKSFPDTGPYEQTPGDIYGGDPVGVLWETFDPRTGTRGHATQTVYVGVADNTGNSIYRSTDGGATWAAVPGQPTGFLPHHGVLSSTGQLYVTYDNGIGPYDGSKGDVWKLDTATGAWTKISPVPSTDSNDYFGYGGLTVDAQHPNTLMVAALNSWWPDTIFFRSLDGGATWTRSWDWGVYPNRILRYQMDASNAPWLDFGTKNPVPPNPQVKLGWMVDSLEIDPFNSNHLLYGTGATLFGTSDLTNWDTGAAPVHISVAAKGIEETAVLDLISPPTGAHLLSALGDIAGFRHDDLTTSPPEMYTNPSFTTTRALDYAALSPSYVVRIGDPYSGQTGFGYSTDGGSTWAPAATQPANVGFGGTVAAAADASRVVWAPLGAVVSYSTNNGATWTASAGVPSSADVVADRVNPMRFYAWSNGTIYVSNDGGVTFTPSAATGLSTYGAQLKATPGHEGDLWLAGPAENPSGPPTPASVSGLWHSSDGGLTFARVRSVTAADNIGFGKPAPEHSYPALYSTAVVDGYHTIYRSDDAGRSWVQITDARHQFAFTGAAITGDPRIYGRVYVSSNGFGIHVGDIAKG